MTGEEKQSLKNIILCGMMASGKTTYAKALAQYFNYRVIDLDALIEEKESQSIREIFKNKGEDYFRHLESKCLEEIVGNKIVLSLGGGTLNLENIEKIKSLGVLFYLKTPLEVLAKRLESTDEKVKRPLLAQKKLQSILGEREVLYQQAQVIIDTEGKSKRQVLKEMVAQYENFYS